MSNTYFALKKEIDRTNTDNPKTIVQLTLTAFVGEAGDKSIQINIKENGRTNAIPLNSEEITRLVCAINERTIGIVTATGIEKSMFTEIDDFKVEDSIRIVEDSIEKTCSGCPSQWEAKTTKGDDVYIRLRHGHLYVELNDNYVIFNGYPDGYDGVMGTTEMVEYLHNASNITFV